MRFIFNLITLHFQNLQVFFAVVLYSLSIVVNFLIRIVAREHLNVWIEAFKKLYGYK